MELTGNVDATSTDKFFIRRGDGDMLLTTLDAPDLVDFTVWGNNFFLLIFEVNNANGNGMSCVNSSHTSALYLWRNRCVAI